MLTKGDDDHTMSAQDLWDDLPQLPIPHLYPSALKRRPRLARALAALILFILLIRFEWAYFAPRIYLYFHPIPGSYDDSLEVRVMAAEDTYQRALRQRKQLIYNSGPRIDEIDAFPSGLELYTLWDFFPPAFNCPHIVERIGALGVGGKWVCGLERLAEKRDCVVYTFGSSWESSFEASILERTKYCKVYGHHYDSKKFGPEVRSIDRFRWRSKFSKIGLRAEDESPTYRSLASVMFEHGHDFVDLVKIDLEGYEFEALAPLFEAYQDLPLPFGQLQLEIHANGMPFDKVLEWWELLEAAGLRPFFTEPNLVYVNINSPTVPDIAEYSFLNIRGRNVWNSNDATPTLRSG